MRILTSSQISFSMYKDQTELIFHSADPKFFDIFNTIKHKQQHKISDYTKRYRSSKVSLREIIAKTTSNPQEFGDYQRLNVEHVEFVFQRTQIDCALIDSRSFSKLGTGKFVLFA